ncbi:MAG TPA: peptidylprolyl isomerase [Longimicrobiales bacterium]|nr:peptidylprolyl isomerase [Longimicrobiales bacterium]
MTLPSLRSICLPCIAVLVAACARPTVVAPEPLEAGGYVQLDEAGISALGALLRMEDARVLDTALVAAHLASPIAEVRARATLAAARTGDRAATPLLLRALADSTLTVRTRAAFALGELGDTSLVVIQGLSAVALRDRASPAAEAIAAIGRLGSDAGRTAVDSILTRTGGAASVLHETLLAAWRLPRDAGTVQSVARWTSDTDPEVRWRAAYALARNPSPDAIASLLSVVNDADPRVRSYAVRGLRVGQADSAGVRERALAVLLDAARDPYPHVRINAINLLAGYRSSQRTIPVLAHALADTVVNVAVAAAQALAQSDDRASTGALRDATAPDRPDGLRSAALHAWMSVDGATAASAALQWADSSRWLLRMHAARALGRARPAEAAPALRQLARDQHPLVAAEALAAVRSIADSIPDARRIFIEQLGAAHPLVRAAATRGLSASAGAADLDLLLQAYDRARQDSVRDAAVAAVQALAGARRAGVPVERTFFLRFGGGGPPRDAVVHRLIMDSIGEPPAAWREPASPIRVQPAAFYEGIIRTYVAPVLAGAPPVRAVIATTHGDIVLELASADAPLTVHNFVSLIERGYYTGTRWHRVVPNFVIQDGDPRGDGSGGPGYAIRDEINPLRYMRGTLGMALSGPDTGGSQYFITHSPQPHLDGGYTVFGSVVDGLDVVDRVVQDDPILSMRVLR